MHEFVMNGYVWNILYVPTDSKELINDKGQYTLACTDPETRLIFINKELTGDMYVRVLLHELAHCALFSFDLVNDIHAYVKPEYWEQAEEWVCNFLANYGPIIYEIESKLFIHYPEIY